MDSVIGRDCVVWASVLESAEVEDEVTIGPFSHLRPGASIGRGARLGNFAEVKGSRLEPGVVQHHFSYIGDATVGARTNIGAGTVTCNFDGVHKHRTVIGEEAFIGSDTMLVAPITVGDGARTGAGSVVTHDVPAGRTAVGVPARLRPLDVAPGDGEPGCDEPSGAAPGPDRRSTSDRREESAGGHRAHPMNDLLPELLVIFVLVMVNGVFVAAEISLVTLRRSRLEQLVDEGSQAALRVRRLVDQPSRFLAVIQVGVTFIGFLASAFAAVSLARALEASLAQAAALRPYAGVLALVVVTILLSAFTIVFGELVPKTLALAHPDRFALALSGPVDLLGRLLAPVVWVLTGLTARIAGLFGADASQASRISTEELMLIVERGGQQGVLEAEEEQMIHAVIELGDRRLHEVMVPRIDIVGLHAGGTFEEAIDTIVDAGHSRIPVYEESVDEVIGILYAKDLLPFVKAGVDRPSLRSLLRTPLFVPESMTIDDLLHELQRRKVHIAIVVDEYGGTAGLVTIEDLLEEIVGEIQDEYDVEEPISVRLSDDEVRIDGRAPVDDLAELFDVELQLADQDEYDTVGGLIYHRIGGVPKPGDRVFLQDGLTLTVETTDGRRVGKVLAVRERGEGESEQEGTDR